MEDSLTIQAIALATTSRLKLTLHCQLRGNLQKTVQKHTKACRLYKALLYPERLKPGEYFSPEFVKTDFKRSLVQYRLPKLSCYSCSLLLIRCVACTSVAV